MATAIKKYSKHFNATNLINKVFECFGRIKDHRSRSCPIPFENFLMSAFAMMHQKYDSLLGFDDERVDKIRCHNLEKLYHVKDGKVLSDTQMRAVVDLINPDDIRKPFKKLFSIIQRNGALNGFKFNCDKLKDHYLLPIDGTGLFYSGKCGCKDCCIKNEGKKNEAFYHNMMGGCIAHPDQKTVIPLEPEAIIRQDGCTKNDCEKNAIKRFFAHVKRVHPLLKLIILLDGLYADNPTIALIKKYGWHYIIVAKDGNHVSLIEAMNALYDEGEVHHHKINDKKNGVKHNFRFANNVSLNLQDQVEKVNVLDYIEIDKKGHQHNWCWVTDIELNEETVHSVMRGGRCRWHIKNQTFNTLKNQGYHLEHNYGHGKEHLATNFAYLTFLAFLVDQIQEMSSPEFQKALKKRSRGTRKYLWKRMTCLFISWMVDSWEDLFSAITNGFKPEKIKLDTS